MTVPLAVAGASASTSSVEASTIVSRSATWSPSSPAEVSENATRDPRPARPAPDHRRSPVRVRGTVASSSASKIRPKARSLKI